jgi:hypothetical protein
VARADAVACLTHHFTSGPLTGEHGPTGSTVCATPNALRALRLQEFPVCAGQRRSHPVRVCSLAAERKDLLGVLLHRRTASAARHRFAGPVLAKRCIHLIGATDVDVELFSRFTAGTCRFNKARALSIHQDMVCASAILCESMRQTGLTPASSESPFSPAGDMLQQGDLLARRHILALVYLHSGSATPEM